MSTFETVPSPTEPSYFCPKHGDQGSFIGIQVQINVTKNTPDGLKAYAGKRNYCMACGIDWMDANMEQLTEVSPRTESDHAAT